MGDDKGDQKTQSPVTRHTGTDRAVLEPLPKKVRPSLDQECTRDTAGVPQKDQKQKSKTTFKALGNVVLAMKRFQASLNPTYTYGKQSTSATTSSSHGALDASGIGQYSYPDRGHRADLLLRRLPDVDDEAGSTLKESKSN